MTFYQSFKIAVMARGESRPAYNALRFAAAAICRTCQAPIVRDWAPTDPTLANYHAGCRPGAGRLPYRAAEDRS
jgi:hypothetical protein